MVPSNTYQTDKPLTDRENTNKHVEEEMDQKPVSVITKEGHSGDFQHLFGNNTSR